MLEISQTYWSLPRIVYTQCIGRRLQRETLFKYQEQHLMGDLFKANTLDVAQHYVVSSLENVLWVAATRKKRNQRKKLLVAIEVVVRIDRWINGWMAGLDLGSKCNFTLKLDHEWVFCNRYGYSQDINRAVVGKGLTWTQSCKSIANAAERATV